MATAPKNFWRGELPDLDTIIYTAPANGQAIITDIVATNVSASSALIAIKINGVPLLANVGIHPNGVFTLRISQVLEPNDSISIQGNAATAYAHISGVEVA
ncbi:hypothetical protein D854_gp68 [Streptomyces phage R4]|uniref:Uncharacterized protein n=2 Tax=Arequatrovirus TaxID=1982881 RepID=K4IB82_9CAUD|nr:hypothetical protein D854_gp68 [Streptomyces phage R4]YP_009591479.1 hypothetical protein FDG59_gp64 [Streptomyces phage phiELB20]AFO10886.1 hypothetical protein ELB20_20 [Streptomyces phage phiELB20]AFU62074.1 hypothetical protein R4_21 [Streptomyces phage R4]